MTITVTETKQNPATIKQRPGKTGAFSLLARVGWVQVRTFKLPPGCNVGIHVRGGR